LVKVWHITSKRHDSVSTSYHFHRAKKMVGSIRTIFFAIRKNFSANWFSGKGTHLLKLWPFLRDRNVPNNILWVSASKQYYFSSKNPLAFGSGSFQLDQQFPGVHMLSLLHEDGPDHSGPGSGNIGFHFHGLNNEQALVLFHLVPFRNQYF